ncbi:MAG: hypothetical protein QM734_02215 [Cyclobacteriaceae bacterium]
MEHVYGLANKEFYFKSQEEMKSIFRDMPEAIETISEIIDKIESYTSNETCFFQSLKFRKSSKQKMTTCAILLMKAQEKVSELTSQ